MQSEELWEGGQYNFVFSSDMGKPLHKDVPPRWWRRFLNRTGFKKVRFHDLRHTFATDLINKGGNIYKISKYLGHASISTTMDIYGHYIEDDKEIFELVSQNYM